MPYLSADPCPLLEPFATLGVNPGAGPPPAHSRNGAKGMTERETVVQGLATAAALFEGFVRTLDDLGVSCPEETAESLHGVLDDLKALALKHRVLTLPRVRLEVTRGQGEVSSVALAVELRALSEHLLGENPRETAEP